MTENNSNKNGTVFIIPRRMLIFLFSYFVAILVVCMGLSIFFVMRIETIETEEVIMYTVLSSLSICGMTCSIRYLRKLYKACINEKISCNQNLTIEQLGFVIYFILRPFFAFAFSLLMILMLLAGLYLVSGSLDYVVNNRFLYLCITLSGCIGYSIGRFIDTFEKHSESFVQNIVK
jgi:hypothetical protein